MSPLSSATTRKALAAVAAAGALSVAVASAGAAAPSPTSAMAPGVIIKGAPVRTEPAAGTDAVYADIRVELSGPAGYAGDPFTFVATNRLVGPGPELTHADLSYSPFERWSDVNVDITLDPLTVYIDGGEYVSYGSAYLEVTLHGKDFGAVTVTHDDLFSPEVEGLDSEQVDSADSAPSDGVSGFTGSGGRGMAAPLMTAVLDYPTLQSYGVAGSTFAASWLGTYQTSMSGSATFSLTPTAPAPVVPAASPVFTG